MDLRRPGRPLDDRPAVGRRREPELDSILAGIDAARSRRSTSTSPRAAPTTSAPREEFEKLSELKALTDKTVVIHGTALTRPQLADMKDAGAKLVWSPQSNLRLYGETTRAADALELGLPVGLGADWLPSGSTSLLAELKVARRELVNQGARADGEAAGRHGHPRRRQIAGLDDKLGQLEAGRPADLVVLERRERTRGRTSSRPIPLGRAGHDRRRPRLRPRGLARALAEPAAASTRAADRLGQADAARHELRGQPGRRAAEARELRADLIKEYPQVGPIFA